MTDSFGQKEGDSNELCHQRLVANKSGMKHMGPHVICNILREICKDYSPRDYNKSQQF